MSSQQLQMASVPIEPNSLFRSLMWNDSIDASYWGKPLVGGNYVQHLSLLVESFHFIYSSFIFLCEKEKTKSDQTHWQNKATEFTPMYRDGKILLSFALKSPDALSHTRALTVEASVTSAQWRRYASLTQLVISGHISGTSFFFLVPVFLIKSRR